MSTLQYLALIFAALPGSSAHSQREVSIGPPRPEAPKTVVFYFSVTPPSTFKMERLGGEKIKVLTSDDRGYETTGIVFEDGRGTCKLENVPPGEYGIEMDVFKLKTTISIPAVPLQTVSFDMRIGSSIEIMQRTKVDR